MKRNRKCKRAVVSVLLAAVMVLLLPCAVVSFAAGGSAIELPDVPAEGETLLGDVDRDGFVTTTDARLVLMYTAESITLAQLPDSAAADVDGSGTITTTDARLILAYAAELIDSF